MHGHRFPRAFAISLVALFLSTAASAQLGAAGRCSAGAIAGKWSFTSEGFVVGIGPVAAVARFTIDASGNISGGQTRSLNGDVAEETFTGTLPINADCTGEATVQVFQDGNLVRTTTLHIVFDDNERSARGIFTSLVLPDGTTLPTIITLEGTRLFVHDDD